MASGIGNFFLGTPSRTEQVQKFNQPQQNAFSQILQQALSGLQNPQAGFEPIANQARSQFQRKTIPSIMERFSNLDAQRSSAFGQDLGEAGSQLEEALAAMGSQYGLQQQGLLQNLLGMGLTPQFDTISHQRTPGFLETLGGGLSQGLGTGLGIAATGGFGGLSGAAGAGGGFMEMLKRLLGSSQPSQQQATSTVSTPVSRRQFQPYQSPTIKNLQMVSQMPNLSALRGGY